MKILLINLFFSIILCHNVIAQCTTNAGIDEVACGQTFFLQGGLSQPGSTAFWTTTYPGVVFNDPTQPATSVYIPAYSGSSVNVTFVFTETNTGIPCTSSDTVVITFIKPPHTEAGAYQSVCGTTAHLYADTIGSGMVSAFWTSSIPGISINYAGGDPYPWNADIDVSPLIPNFWINSQREVWFYWHGQNWASCSSTDSVRITFYEIPAANAGIDTAVCGKNYTMNASYSIDNAIGIWSHITSPPPPGAAIIDTSSYTNANITASSFGDYFFAWKEMNNGNTLCFDRDTILLTFLTVPMPDAGLDFSICGNCAHIQAITTFPSGHWSSTPGIAYYDTCGGIYSTNYQDSASVYIRYGSENDAVTMYWTEYNGTCMGYDSVNVFFGAISPAVELVDPADSMVCGPTYTLLNAQPPAYGYGYWMDTVMNTQYSPLPTHISPIVTIDTSGGYGYGCHHFYWITVNGNCRDTSTTVRVKFIEKPVANAGGNYWPGIFGLASHIKTDTVCGLSYQMGAIPSVGTGFWYTVYLASLFDSTNTTVTPDPTDSLYLNCVGCYSIFNTTDPQYFQYTWQETNEICVSSDTLRLYFAPIPSGIFTTSPPTCPQNNFEIVANTWALPNNEDYGINYFNWNFPDGILDSIITSPTISDTIFVRWPTGNVHTVTLTAENVWGCNSLPVSHILNEPPSGIVHGQLTSSPATDYSAFEIKVYREEANAEAPLVETVLLNSSGNYNFGVPGAGNFYLLAKLINPGANIPFANSYYNNAFEWANAQTVTLTCQDTVNLNIPLYGYAPATGGQCRIYGLVRYDETLAPVQNTTVYMRYQPNQDPARFELTNQNGYYSINNVPNGNYKLFVDMPGLPQITNHHIVVNPNDTVFANVNFIVDTSSIHKQYGFGIYADTTGYINVPLNNTDFLKISVFPIPFHQQLNVLATLSTSETISAEVFDNLGKLMISYPEKKYECGEMNLSFPTSQLPSGIYFLKVTVGKSIYIKKIARN